MASNALKLSSALLLALAGAQACAADNPMAFVGQSHNQHLACLKANAEPGVSPLVILVKRCGVQPGMPIRQFVDTYRPIIEADPSMPLAERMLPYRDRFTDYEFGFFDRIDEVTVSAADEQTATRMFAELETEAVANLDVRTFGGQSVLAAIAVARHSLDFWIRHEPIPADLPAERKFPRWLRKLLVVGADVAGAALMLTIFPTSPLSGPVSSAASELADELLPQATP